MGASQAGRHKISFLLVPPLLIQAIDLAVVMPEPEGHLVYVPEDADAQNDPHKKQDQPEQGDVVNWHVRALPGHRKSNILSLRGSLPKFLGKNEGRPAISFEIRDAPGLLVFERLLTPDCC